jgi:hypothetical protein
MSKPRKVVWPLASETAICLPQTLAAAGNLKINGDFFRNFTMSTSSPLGYNEWAELPGIRRTVTVSCGADISAVVFTIRGLTDSGREISANVTGVNNNTVETDFNAGEIFHTITSVSANAAVGSAVSVGTGYKGYTLWFRNDYNRIISHLTVAVYVTGTATYSFETTLDDPDVLGDFVTIWQPIDGVTTPTIPAASTMTGATTSIMADLTIPTNCSRIEISDSDDTGYLEIWFLNQGIT